MSSVRGHLRAATELLLARAGAHLQTHFPQAVPMWRYAKLTVQHKVFVFAAGRRLGVGFAQLLRHDLSKFGPSELPHYARQFFGAADDPLGFTRAWLHHQNSNPHHWEYWVPRTGHTRGGYLGGEPLPMPEPYVREMVADWLGAGRAYQGEWPQSFEGWAWFHANVPGMQLHPDTRLRVTRAARAYFR